MGYSTSFSGNLIFAKELKASELSELNKFLEEDCRDHPEWGNTNLTYIDLKLNNDFNGLEWNGSEKTYDLVEKVNFVIDKMQNKCPDFELTGELLAQGEEVGDIWRLVMENNVAYARKIDLSHKKKITCPHCDKEFFLEEDKSYNGKFVFVFTGFRDVNLVDRLEKLGHSVVENVTKDTTHLIMKDTNKKGTKHTKALSYDCILWSKEHLENFLKEWE